MAHVTWIAAAQIKSSLKVLSLAESSVDRFFNESQVCLRQAQIAINPFDKTLGYSLLRNG
jgi:hypothetical protein